MRLSLTPALCFGEQRLVKHDLLPLYGRAENWKRRCWQHQFLQVMLLNKGMISNLSLYIQQCNFAILNIFLLLKLCHRACACAKAGLPPPDLSLFTFLLPTSQFRPSLCICEFVYFCNFVFVYLCSFASSTPENPLVYKPSYHFAKLSVIAIVQAGKRGWMWDTKSGWKWKWELVSVHQRVVWRWWDEWECWSQLGRWWWRWWVGLVTTTWVTWLGLQESWWW